MELFDIEYKISIFIKIKEEIKRLLNVWDRFGKEKFFEIKLMKWKNLMNKLKSRLYRGIEKINELKDKIEEIS